MRVSIPVANSMEIIQTATISPLVSKGLCKVCWVGQKPNRNHTIITKEVATKMGEMLPGTPVVGYYNETDQDFGAHDREVKVENGQVVIVDLTKAYGFVPTDAKPYFQDFEEDNTVRTYLVVEVYIWTGIYPESERVIEQGSGQSMELADMQGTWTWIDGKAKAYVLNSAVIEKLCILGENHEPCFEGAQISKEFALSRYTMMYEAIQEEINKGGSRQMEELQAQVESLQSELADAKAQYEAANERVSALESKIETAKSEYEAVKNELEDAKNQFEAMQAERDDISSSLDATAANYAALESEKAEADAKITEYEAKASEYESEITSLREFKLNTERDQKKAMIDSFEVLSDEDKAKFVEGIDTYSLEDIEKELSVMCYRLNKMASKKEDAPNGLFSLQNGNNDIPEWVKMAKAIEC